MGSGTSQVSDKHVQDMQDYCKNIDSRINILVIGDTGVGKSTLIRAYVKDPKIVTDSGMPVTEGISIHEIPGGNISFYDTRGFETGNYEKTTQAVLTKLDESAKSWTKSKQMHIIWYLISFNHTDITPSVNLIRQLRERLPVITVITRSVLEHSDCYERLKNALGENAPIIPVMARPMRMRTGDLLPISGVNELTKITIDNIMPALNIASLSSAKNWRSSARWLSSLVVAGAATGATAVGLIPFMISPVELTIMSVVDAGMLASIAAIYRIKLTKEVIKKLAELFLIFGGKSQGAKTITRCMVSTGAKVLPVIGSIPVLGDIISAAAGAAVTIATGTCFILAIEEILDDVFTRAGDDRAWPPKDITESLTQSVCSRIEGTSAECETQDEACTQDDVSSPSEDLTESPTAAIEGESAESQSQNV